MQVYHYRLPEYQESPANTKCCETPAYIEQNGFTVCSSCGVVHSAVFDSARRRAFTPDEVSKRINSEPVYSPIGPRTIIKGSMDSKGHLMNARLQMKYSRLGKIHRSLTSSYERNLWIALPNFQRVQEKIGLPKPVIKDAVKIYKSAVKAKLTMGRSINILMAACIFVSLKIHGLPRVVEEILQAIAVPKKNVVKCYRILLMQILPEMGIRVTHLGPLRYIDKFGEELKLPMIVRQDAIRMLKKARNNGLLIEGKDPKGLAAAALYISGHFHKLPRTQNQIAKLSHVTEVTLRVRVRDIKRFCPMPKKTIME